MSDSPKQQIEKLRKEIEQHNYNYYVAAQPLISDIDFDKLMKRLEALENEFPEFKDPHSPTQRVGSDLTGGFKSYPHRVPMLSLANTYNFEEVTGFWQRVLEVAGKEEVAISAELKFDGLSIALHYHNGYLEQALTRGDGLVGDDVTANVRTIRSIPLKLRGTHIAEDIEVRGEVLMPFAEFERINRERQDEGEDPFANPRNAASGTLKMLNPEVVSHRHLDAVFYYLFEEEHNLSTQELALQRIAELGLKSSPHAICCHSLEEILDFINYWADKRHSLPYPTDGVVLKVEDKSLYEALGTTAKSPRWAIAYKFPAEQAKTKLENVSFQVGRTGVITPVANFAAIPLSGTIVKRATLHNADFMAALDLHEGDWITVEKGGEIIPKVVSTDPTLRDPQAKRIAFVSLCPECGTPLIQNEAEVAWYCPNKEGCAPQTKALLEHFAGRKAANINIGSETISQLYDLGFLRRVDQFYTLTPQQLAEITHFKDKAINNLLRSIEASKARPYESFLFGLGIPFVGEKVAQILAKAFPDIEQLAQASSEELEAINDIGNKIAGSIKGWFAIDRHRTIIHNLQQAGISLSTNLSEKKEQVSTALLNKSIVISGTFEHHSRDEYEALIVAHGGKRTGSISGKTSFILAGKDMGPTKLEKAHALGIPIIGEEEFLSLIGEKEG